MSDDLERFKRSWELPKTRVHAGRQIISGDQLFISDPLDIAQSPLTTRTPVGSFEVVVYQRDWTHHPRQPIRLVNAFLALAFSSNSTERWEQVEAETPGAVYTTN